MACCSNSSSVLSPAPLSCAAAQRRREGEVDRELSQGFNVATTVPALAGAVPQGSASRFYATPRSAAALPRSRRQSRTDGRNNRPSRNALLRALGEDNGCRFHPPPNRG